MSNTHRIPWSHAIIKLLNQRRKAAAAAKAPAARDALLVVTLREFEAVLQDEFGGASDVINARARSYRQELMNRGELAKTDKNGVYRIVMPAEKA